MRALSFVTLIVFALPALADEHPTDVRQIPEAASLIRVESRTTITESTGHVAFPDLARLPDGRLIVVYREGEGHVEPSGRIVRQFGAPDGLEWGPAEVVWDTPMVDDRDPSLSLLQSGELLLTSFWYSRIPTPYGTISTHQVFVTRSSDQGKSFETPIQASNGPMEVEFPLVDRKGLWVDQGQVVEVWATTSPAVELEEALIIPNYGGFALDVSDLERANRSIVNWLVSHDGGASFEEQRLNIQHDPQVWYQEPALLLTRSGRLIMQVRTATGISPGGPGPLMQTISLDGGQSFSPFTSLEIIGHAPYLLELESGLILSAFRFVNPEYTHQSVGIMASRDQGLTFGEVLVIEECGREECGYPSMVELTPNRVLIVYYASGATRIESAILQLEE